MERQGEGKAGSGGKGEGKAGSGDKGEGKGKAGRKAGGEGGDKPAMHRATPSSLRLTSTWQ